MNLAQKARARNNAPEVDEVGVEQDVVGGAQGVVGAEEHGRRLAWGGRKGGGGGVLRPHKAGARGAERRRTCLGILSSSLSFMRFSGAVFPERIMRNATRSSSFFQWGEENAMPFSLKLRRSSLGEIMRLTFQHVVSKATRDSSTT